MAKSQEEYLCKLLETIQPSFPDINLLDRVEQVLSALGKSKVEEINEKASVNGTEYPAAWACLKVVLAANSFSLTPSAFREYKGRRLERLELQLKGKIAQLEDLKDDPWTLGLWDKTPLALEIEDEIADLNEQIRCLKHSGEDPRDREIISRPDLTSRACRAAREQFEWLKKTASRNGQPLQLSLSHKSLIAKTGPIERVTIAALGASESDESVREQIRMTLLRLEKSFRN